MISEKNERTGNEKPQIGKFVFLAIIAFALTSFPPLSILAPAPLAFGLLLFGRSKGIGLACFYAVSFCLLSIYYPKTFPLLGPASILLALEGVLLAQLILKKVPPKKGFVLTGISIVLGAVVLIGLMTLLFDFNIEKFIESLVMGWIEKFNASKGLEGLQGDELRKAKDFIENPKTYISGILTWMPVGTFVITIFSVWASFYVILRNSLLWRGKVSYPYGLRDLLNFKMPDYFVWPLIVALALTLGGEYLLGETGVLVGTNILYMLGIFYFFQGFGVVVDSLDHFKIFGFIRTLLLAFSFFFFWRVIVIVGVFDLWINFRKFLKKNK